jgi:hypothetical protein
VDPQLTAFWNRQMRFSYKTYTRRNLAADVVCPFCREKVAPGKVMLGRHLGQHMEEISFAVVTKPYEEWKFYDDTLSSGTNIFLL